MTEVIGPDGSKKISKEDLKIETLGELDELNSLLGVCRAEFSSEEPLLSVEHSVTFLDIQNDLFTIQAEIAGGKPALSIERVSSLEKFIDSAKENIPEIKGFTVTGGTRFSSYVDLARAITRRVERRMVALSKKDSAEISKPAKSYINRLSSFLFVLARLSASTSGIKEESPGYLSEDEKDTD